MFRDSGVCDWARHAFSSRMAMVVTAGACSVLALSGCGGSSGGGLEGPLVGRIAFSSLRDGNAEIYTAFNDGTQQQRLTVDAGVAPPVDTQPSYSRDGSQITWVSTRGTGADAEIYVMDATGANQRALTENTVADSAPSFNPSGTLVVYSRGGNIFTVPTTGFTPPAVPTSTQIATAGIEPSFSPDGQKIVFISTRDGNREIYDMDANGTNQRRLTTTPTNEFNPRYSPNGQRLVYRQPGVGVNAAILVSDALASTPVEVVPADFNNGPADWNAAGTRLVFASNRTGGTGDLFIVRPIPIGTSNVPLRVTTAAAASDPSWQ
jgi:TolB protein